MKLTRAQQAEYLQFKIDQITQRGQEEEREATRNGRRYDRVSEARKRCQAKRKLRKQIDALMEGDS